MAARLLIMLPGAWLVISVFVWPHSTGQRSIGMTAGLLAIVLRMTGLGGRPLRFLNALVGALLVCLGLFATKGRRPDWNELGAGTAMFVLSLLPLAGFEPFQSRITSRQVR